MILRHRQSAARRGFTLIEVLVTLALMGIVFPVALRGVAVAVSNARFARNQAEAATLGQSKLNEIVAMMQIEQTNTLGNSGDFGQQWPAYTWTYEETYNQDLAVIEATLVVHWSEPSGSRTLRIPTMIMDSVAVDDYLAQQEAAAGT